MKFQVSDHLKCVNYYKDKNSVKWPYIKASKNGNTNVSYENILGDTIQNMKDYDGLLTMDDHVLKVKSKDKYIGSKYKVVGYIPCVDEDAVVGYIRILKKKSKIAIIFFLLLLTLSLFLGVWNHFSNKTKIDLDNAAISYQMPNGMKNNNPEEIMMPVFNELRLGENTDKISVGFVNPDGNPCYFKYSIVLVDSGEKIYESGWIEPGTAVVEVKVNKKLEKGRYPITIKIDTGSLKDPNIELNNGELESVLVVG